MRKNVFKLTFYYGLTLLLIPIFLVSLILIITFVNGSKDVETEPLKKEITVRTKKIIVHDTIIIEKVKPKYKSSPIVDTQQDTEQITDTLNP
jgi:uncharacterized membrane protein YqjE